MRYICLLRGVNVGGNRKVSMAELKRVFTNMGFTDVSSYINSGNIIFSSSAKPDAKILQANVEKYFGFDLDLLILSTKQMVAIAEAIPKNWTNDVEQKSDVLYLFPDVDTSEVIDKIGYRPEFETIQYVSSALITNISRKNQTKSSLLKLMGTPFYKQITIRNINTARKLAELMNL